MFKLFGKLPPRLVIWLALAPIIAYLLYTAWRGNGGG